MPRSTAMAAQVAVTPLVVEDSMNSVSPSTGRPDASSAKPAQASTTTLPARYAATCSPTSGPSSTSVRSTWRAEALGSEDVTDCLLRHVQAFEPRVVIRGCDYPHQQPVAR